MKKTTMIIIILSGLCVCMASMLLSHTNDNKELSRITISGTPTTVTTQTTDKRTENFLTKSTTVSNEKITIETSTIATEITVTDESSEDLYININTANLETLCKLNGIGETIAEEIIRYREENGGFNNIEEIMNVHRIGEKVFEKIREHIYVDNPYYPDEDEDEENSVIIHDEESLSETLENESIEPIEPTDPTESPLTLDDVAPIELNSADKELLMYLPYVDENIADKIISLRESIHGFNHVYELLYVEELTDTQVEEIIKYVYIA